MLICALLLASCTTRQDPKPAAGTDAAGSAAAQERASAEIAPAGGSNAHGTAEFTREGNGIRIIIVIAGLTPGDHGVHIHETGDCGAPDASTAGPHFNPAGMNHGAPTAAEHHAGDLGNITAGENGVARLDYVTDDLSFDGDRSIIGRALIVHAGKDDLTSQPAGSSGARIACGVIVRR